MHHATPAFEHSHRDERTDTRGRRDWGRIALGFLRAHVLIIGICAGLLLAYTLAGFFLVPRLVRSQLTAFVTETLHQRIAIGEIRFNPFTFEASAHQLQVSDPQGRELVGFRHIYVDAELASLWQRAVVLKEVELVAPSVQLIVERDGTVNLNSLRPPATTDDTTQDEDLPIRIGTFALREGRVGIQDLTRPRPFAATVAPIRFTLIDFKTDAGHRNGYHFAGTSASGERLDWQGAFTVQPLGSTGQFTIGALHLKTLESYFEQSLPFRLSSGDADLAGNYRFALDPMTLDVTMPSLAVRNLSLARRDIPDTVPFRAAEVKFQEFAFSLERRDVRIRAIQVTDANIDVARDPDGTIDLPRLLVPPPDASEPAAPSESSPDWHAAIGAVQIANATVHAEDRAVEPVVRLELTAVDGSVENWHNGADAEVKLALAGDLNKKGRLEATGTMKLEPLNATTTFAIERFELATLQPYVAQSAAMTLHSGTLDVKGKLHFDASNEDAPNAEFDGDVRVTDFRTTDDALNQDFLKWGTLAVDGIAYKHSPASLDIARIAASRPYANVIIAEDGTVNVSRVLNKNAEPETPAATSPAKKASPAPPHSEPTMPMSVRVVQVENGSANFADRSIQPSFAAKIVDLQGKVTGLSSKGTSRAKVALNGKVDEYAPVDISGEVNVLAATKYSDLAMNFRNMELTTFNPYSGKFAGYNISKGKLSTELKYRIEDRKLQADHHIVVDNLEFGAKTDSKDAAPIPIKLGVALLKDRNGVIDVNLPVSGTLDDPQFRLGPIIWKAVLGLLTKIVTAPFAALGALFGGGDELAYVDFAPGSAELTATETEKLAKLAQALAERPALRLDVPVTGLTAADTEAVAKKSLEARIPDEIAAEPAEESAQRKRLGEYEKIYKGVVGQSPAYPEELKAKEASIESKRAWLESEMLQKLKPDTTALDALARERARAVQTALLTNTQVQPERVFITTDRTAAATKEGAVRMELKLE